MSMSSTPGTQDGYGASDRDVPYRFGRVPTSRNPFPFNPRQFGRLLVLRSRLVNREKLRLRTRISPKSRRTA